MVLDLLALGSIFFMLVLVAVVIALIGSAPGKIARRRGHPWPEAVEAASWVGLVTVLAWPLAFVWAFLPLPSRPTSSQSDASRPDGENAQLADRIAALEMKIEELQSKQEGTT